jgi:hypothetical protein
LIYRGRTCSDRCAPIELFIAGYAVTIGDWKQTPATRNPHGEVSQNNVAHIGSDLISRSAGIDNVAIRHCVHERSIRHTLSSCLFKRQLALPRLQDLRRSIRQYDEVHAAPFNWHSPALKSKYIANVHHLPRYSDGPAAWVASVLSILRATSFDLVISCDDPAILPLHAHRDAFSEFPIAIPSPEVIELLFDKERTRQLCDQLEIPVTAGARLGSDDTAKALIGRFGLPLVLKPRQSYWVDRLDVRGATSIVEDESKLATLLGTIGDRSRYLVESYSEGAGVGVSVLAEGGRILHAFQHRRLREGWGGCSSYRISQPIDNELYRACERICTHTRLTGVCMFEFRYNLATRNWILIETSARFGDRCRCRFPSASTSRAFSTISWYIGPSTRRCTIVKA